MQFMGKETLKSTLKGGVTLEKTSLEKNKVKRAAARRRWPSLAAAAHERLLWASPTQTLMLTSSLQLFLPFSGLITRTKVILERTHWHKCSVHACREAGPDGSPSAWGWFCVIKWPWWKLLWGSGHRRDTHSPQCSKQTLVSSRWLLVTSVQTTFLLFISQTCWEILFLLLLHCHGAINARMSAHFTQGFVWLSSLWPANTV